MSELVIEKKLLLTKTEMLGNLIGSGCNCVNPKVIIMPSRLFEFWIKEEKEE
jgi:hypothetical protein